MTTRVVTRKIAHVVLDDGATVDVEAEYEPDGSLNCLVLKQDDGSGSGAKDMVVLAELGDVAQLVKAIAAVMPDLDAARAEGGDA